MGSGFLNGFFGANLGVFFKIFRGRPARGLILILACSWVQLACSLMSVR